MKLINISYIYIYLFIMSHILKKTILKKNNSKEYKEYLKEVKYIEEIIKRSNKRDEQMKQLKKDSKEFDRKWQALLKFI